MNMELGRDVHHKLSQSGTSQLQHTTAPWGFRHINKHHIQCDTYETRKAKGHMSTEEEQTWLRGSIPEGFLEEVTFKIEP